MPIQNANLETKIRTYQESEQLKTILNEILAAPNTIVDFRNVIIKHKKFFGYDAEATADDKFLTDEGDLGQHNGKNDLLAMAATKRVIIGLQQANDNFLLTLISQTTEDEVRQFLVSQGQVTGINNTILGGAGIIDDEKAKAIQIAAKTRYFLNKLKNIDNIKVIEEYLKDDQHRNPEPLLKSCDVTNTNIINLLKQAPDVFGGIEEELHKRHFEINAVNFVEANNDAEQTLNLADDKLWNKLIHDYEILGTKPKFQLENINALRTALANACILQFINTAATPDQLKLIADQNNADELRTKYNANKNLNDAVKKAVFTQQNIASYRAVAAGKILEKEIANSYDLEALKSLGGASTLEVFKSRLNAHPSLGFAGTANNNLRNVITMSEATNAIETAFIRHTLLSGNAKQLGALIGEETAADGYANRYKVQFSLPAHIKPEHINSYFADKNNRNNARKLAVTGFVKAEVQKLDSNAWTEFDAILDVNNKLTDRKLEDWVDESLNKKIDWKLFSKINQLFEYCNAERIIYGVSASAPSKEYNSTLIDQINTINNNFGSLPAPDQKQLQLKFTELLAKKCSGENMPALLELGLAKNTDEFKIALGKLEITSSDWVTSQPIEDIKNIQKAACQTAIAYKVNNTETISDSHPKLIQVLTSKDMPLEKQQKLLENPGFIPALLTHQSEKELSHLLGVPRSALNGVEKEYKRVTQVGKIFNSKIAEILLNQFPRHNLSDDNVNQINGWLITQPPINNLTLLGNIGQMLGISPQELNAAFKINNSRLDKEIDDEISDQRVYNNDLSIIYSTITSTYKNTYDFLLSLKKNQLLNKAHVEELVKLIAAAKDSKTCIAELNTAAYAALRDALPQNFASKLTTAIFNELKRPITQGIYAGAGFQAQLDADIVVFTTIKNKFENLEKVDKKIFDELERLSQIPDMVWLTPGFEATAKKNAHEIGKDFQTVAAGCDVIVTNLKDQQKTLEEQRASLPEISVLTDEDQKSALQMHKDDLEKQLALIREKLQVYERLQRRLYGNPNGKTPFVRKGILNTVYDAYYNKADIKFTNFTTAIQDYPLSEMPAHLKNWQGKSADPGAADGDMQICSGYANAYRKYSELEGGRVKPGWFREYTILSDAPEINNEEEKFPPKKEEGHFIEERHYDQDFAAKTHMGKVSFEPSFTMTVNKFPTHPNGRVEFSMALASQVLAGMNNPPTKDNPIVLKKGSAEELAFVWTALVVLGKQNPNFKFDMDAIQVESNAFNPATQKGTFYGFAGGTVHEKYFKKHPAVSNMSEGIKELSADKVKSSGSAEKEQVAADVKNASSLFKNELKLALNEMEKDNKDSPSAPTMRN